MNDLASLLPFVLIVAVFWFLVLRPARRQQQKLAATQAAVHVGGRVMLGSGFYGTVMSVDDDTLQLEIAPGTTVTVARQSVVRVIDEQGPAHSENHASDDAPNDLQD